MDFAVVKIGSKQFKVSKGDTFEIDKISDNKDKKIKFEEVLLVSQDGKVKIGTPIVKGASVTASLLGDKKGDKIRVSKFKSKVRYRRTIGFRPLLSEIKIEKIDF